MIDKVSGQAIYAVMSFGGFLGVGKKHNPLPWDALKYDEKKSGYVINMDKKQLQRLAELRHWIGFQMDSRVRPQGR